MAFRVTPSSSQSHVGPCLDLTEDLQISNIDLASYIYRTLVAQYRSQNIGHDNWIISGMTVNYTRTNNLFAFSILPGVSLVRNTICYVEENIDLDIDIPVSATNYPDTGLLIVYLEKDTQNILKDPVFKVSWIDGTTATEVKPNDWNTGDVQNFLLGVYTYTKDGSGNITADSDVTNTYKFGGTALNIMGDDYYVMST